MIINKNKSIKNGFTVIEVIVAITIFGIATMAILGYFVYMVKIVRLARNTTIATNLAQGIIDQQMVKSYDELTPQTGAKTYFSVDTTNPYNAFQYQLNISLIDSNLSTSITDVGLKRIDTTIFWNDGTTEKNINISSIMSQR